MPIAIFAIIGVIAFSLLVDGWTVVPAGHVGVKVTMGSVDPVPLEEGFAVKTPFVTRVHDITTRLLTEDATATAASKDLQVVTTEVTTQYSLIGSTMATTYQRVGRNARIIAEAVIDPGIQESVKSVTAQYTAEELVTRRAEVKAQIQSEIEAFVKDTLEEKGVPNGVQLANVAITEFQFSEEFNRAIEEKVRAEQEALKAENEKVRRITQAEAANEERKLAADAEAYQVRQKADAEAHQIEVVSVSRAEAIQREAEALRGNADLIQLRIAEQWDGKLPHFNGGGAVPFVNVPAN